MQDCNATISWGAYFSQKFSNPWNTTAACAGLATSAGWWIYNRLITDPLRTFYFKGWWWHNMPQANICAMMMGNKPEFSAELYDSCDLMREKCRIMVEREFESWDATIMTTLYFTVLTFGVLQMVCHCFVVKPIIYALRR